MGLTATVGISIALIGSACINVIQYVNSREIKIKHKIYDFEKNEYTKTLEDLLHRQGDALLMLNNNLITLNNDLMFHKKLLGEMGVTIHAKEGKSPKDIVHVVSQKVITATNVPVEQAKPAAAKTKNPENNGNKVIHVDFKNRKSILPENTDGEK